MAVSSSQSTGSSRSTSDTYIPEYSESPILREIAQHARAMSDVVYQWGMDTYNKNQGNIDNLMRDALSYASPQRIAVDMGMAEAGVMQAGERGRQSAIRDLESYGIDPSSGRYAALDSANRVMTAAAAAGAGNQQRMASQAAGNAMRNQAISASLQNAQFGSQANRDANAYLATGMSLKYPPLGRWSESSSEQQSTSGSSSESGGGGSKQQQPKEEKEPREKQGGGGGGGGRQAGDGGGGSGGPITGGLIEPKGAGNRQMPIQDVKLPPRTEWMDPNAGTPISPPADDGTMDPNAGTPISEDPNDLNDPNAGTPISPEDWVDPNAGTPISEPDYGDDPNAGTPISPEDWVDPNAGTPISEDQPWMDPNEGIPISEDAPYDPYARQNLAEREAFDPVTGEPVGSSGGDSERVATEDPTGSLYGLGEGGDWTGDLTPAGYTTPEYGGDTWSDIGQGATYDSTYDTLGEDPPGTTDEVGYTDDWTGDVGDDAYGDLGDYDDPYGDWGDQDYYGDEGDYGEGYDDPYADWGEEDYYGDEGDYDWGDESGEGDYDWGDEEDIDYGEGYDDPYEEEEDYDYGETGEEAEVPDYEYDEGGEEYEYEDAGEGGDYGGDYARGGPVRARRQTMQRPGGPPRRPMTGYRQRPPMRRGPPPAFARGGRVPPPGMGLASPGMRPQRPPQAPRPQRGAPMAAPGGPQPTPMIGRGPQMPGNFISANGMPPPTTGGMMRPQRMAGGGSAGRRPEPTTGGFVSRSLSPSGGSTTDDVDARLNAGEFVIPKDVATWKGKEFFYKMIASARKNRSAPNGGQDKPQTGYGGGGMQ